MNLNFKSEWRKWQNSNICKNYFSSGFHISNALLEHWHFAPANSISSSGHLGNSLPLLETHNTSSFLTSRSTLNLWNFRKLLVFLFRNRMIWCLHLKCWFNFVVGCWFYCWFYYCPLCRLRFEVLTSFYYLLTTAAFMVFRLGLLLAALWKLQELSSCFRWAESQWTTAEEQDSSPLALQEQQSVQGLNAGESKPP